MSDYKKKKSFSERQEECHRILRKHPNTVPVIVQLDSKSLPPLDRVKYLVPKDLTVGQFMFVIRRRIKIQKEKALFLFCRKQLPKTSLLISELYNEQKDADGFLYISITEESTFG